MRDTWHMEEVWTWGCDNEENRKARNLFAICQRLDRMRRITFETVIQG
jgi:hypothetical protein